MKYLLLVSDVLPDPLARSYDLSLALFEELSVILQVLVFIYSIYFGNHSFITFVSSYVVPAINMTNGPPPKFWHTLGKTWS